MDCLSEEELDRGLYEDDESELDFDEEDDEEDTDGFLPVDDEEDRPDEVWCGVLAQIQHQGKLTMWR